VNIFGNATTKRMQLYHHDNTDLEFIRRDIVGESTSELDNMKQSKRAWWDPYATLYQCDGYKGIPADAIQLAYSRHFHLEIHDILPDDQRPPDIDSMNTPFITAIAEARAAEITRSAKPRTIYEQLTWMLGVALLIEMLIWGIGYAAG